MKMSRKSFSITITLKAFFADHRGQAKIFINEDIKTISDLEKKITSIFGIKNFHLISNSQLLPSCEDIRLLEKGDAVCVAPNDSQGEIFLLDQVYYISNNEIIGDKTNKRHSLKDECPVREKKCKKKKKEHVSDEEMPECIDEKKKNAMHECIPKSMKEKQNKFKSIEQELTNSSICSTLNDKSNNCCEVFCLKSKKSGTAKFKEKSKKLENCNKKERKQKRVRQENSVCIIDDHSLALNKRSSEDKMNKNMTKKGEQNCDFEVSNRDIQASTNLIEQTVGKCNKKKKIETAKEIGNLMKSNCHGRESQWDKMVTDQASNGTKSHYIKDCKKTKKITNQNNISNGQTAVKKPPIQDVSSSNDENSSDNDCDEPQVKNNTQTGLYWRKKNRISWSTLPLSKTTNHVKICKVPNENLEIDLSKFVFKPSDVGAVPVPNIVDVEMEEMSKAAANSIIMTNGVLEIEENESSVNISEQPIPAESVSTECFLMSGCEEIVNRVPSTSVNDEQRESESTIQTLLSTNSQNDETPESATTFTTSTGNTEFIKTVENNDTDMQNNNNNKTSDDNSANTREFELNEWRQNILKKLSSVSTSSDLKSDKSDANSESCRSKSADKSLPNTVCSAVTKMNQNSHCIKKRSRPYGFVTGVNYYLKLMNKIDWDLTKSISDIKIDELGIIPDNKEIKNDVKSKQIGENGITHSISTDSNLLLRDNFVTKRKRKRKHKKKVRVATPIPSKNLEKLVRSKQLTASTPKIHIRFDNGDYNSDFSKSETDNDLISEPTCINQGEKKTIDAECKIRILQDVGLNQNIEPEGIVDLYSKKVSGHQDVMKYSEHSNINEDITRISNMPIILEESSCLSDSIKSYNSNHNVNPTSVQSLEVLNVNSSIDNTISSYVKTNSINISPNEYGSLESAKASLLKAVDLELFREC